MPTLTIADYLKFANLQMAAEALYGFDATPLDANLTPGALRQDLPLDSANLIIGNVHASKFTPTELALSKLTTDWTVVEHISNTTTGFSGTLFKNRFTNELVLSFRSTEFIDDSARDSEATNKLEIKEKGFAFGQLADMETWYQSIKSKIDGPLSVTGYSLGGHLATAFNLMHQGAAQQVVTFNGAGVGKIGSANDLQSMRVELLRMVQTFNGLRAEAEETGLGRLLQTDAGNVAYLSMKSAIYANNGVPSSGMVSNLYASFVSGGRQFTPSTLADYTLLNEALSRALAVYGEAHRAPGLTSGSTEGIQNPANIKDTYLDHQDVTRLAIAAESLDYQLAVLVTARDFNTSALSNVASIENAFIAKTMGAGSPLANQIDIVGTEMDAAIAASMVANSQVHYGQSIPLFIEDQPGYRGIAPITSAITSFVNAGVKLLGPSYSANDFGDTHSLVLLVDALSVMDTLARIDPTLATKPDDMGKLFQAVTASKAQTQPGRQGIAEGDTLETVVNALGKLFLGNVYADNKLKPATEGLNTGNTWWKPDQREKFYQALNAISTELNSGPQPQRNIVSLATLGAADLQSAATNPDALATRYALKELNPFVALGDDSLYSKFNTHHELDLFNTDTEEGKLGTLTPQWLEDRAGLLRIVIDKNLQDSADKLIAGNTAYKDLTRKLDFGPTTLPQVGVIFGTEQNDSISFTHTRGDKVHFYGGAGADNLTGGAADDWLEGNEGNDALRGGQGADTLVGGTGDDTLRGGLGNDTYRIDKNGGLDTILDAAGVDGSDGQGSIVYNGSTLSGTLTQDTATRNLYRHPDKPALEFRYIGAEGARGSLVIIDPAGARIILQDWASGELGLTLAGSPATSPSRSSIDGDLDLNEYTATVTAVGGVITYDSTWRNIQVLDTTFQYDADGNIAGIASRKVNYNQVDELGNLIGTPGGAARDDSLNGSGNGDRIRGFAGNDTLRGNGGDDSIEGGTDDDRVLAGAGDDRILGGSGSDILQGEADDDTLYAEDAVASDQLYARGETQNATGLRGDWLDGGAGDDTLAGEGGNDMLLGGEGADVLYGGAGDDMLLGSRATQIVSADWQATVSRDPDTQRVVSWGWGNADLLTSAGTAEVADALYGGAGNDLMEGGRGSDHLDGGSGNDYMLGGDGSDYLDGGEGKDEMWGEEGGDALFGGADDDRIVGDNPLISASLHGNDYLDGEDGNDILFGTGGSDELWGGSGNDELMGDGSDVAAGYQGSDYLDGEDGNDRLFGGGDADTLVGGTGDDELVGDADDLAVDYHGADTLDGGGGNDSLYGYGGDDSLLGGEGDDYMEGDGGEIGGIIQLDLTGNDFLDGGGGNDRMQGDGGNDTLLGGIGDDILGGDADNAPAASQGNDLLDGGAGNDILQGYGGNDTLIGGAGTDILHGGTGDDIYVVALGDAPVGATFVEGITDVSGTDTLRFGAGIALGNIRALRVNGSDLLLEIGSDQLGIKNGANGVIEHFELADGSSYSYAQFIGRTWREPISLTSGVADATLVGGTQGDTIVATAGRARVSGGAGSDLITVQGSDNAILYTLGDGTDRVTTTATSASNGNVLRLSGVTADDLRLGLGSLAIQVGPDVNDVIHFENFSRNDVFSQRPFDRIEFDDGSTLGYDALMAKGFDLAGGEGADTIEGTNVTDRIVGGAGNDYLSGGDGQDTLTGGAGDDTLGGGAGNDIYYFARGNGRDLISGDWVDQPDCVNTLEFGPGIAQSDLVFSRRADGSLHIRIGESSDSISIPNWYGTSGMTPVIQRFAFDDGSLFDMSILSGLVVGPIFGTAGNDTLSGTNESDTIMGLAGDDTLSSGRQSWNEDTLIGGAGHDRYVMDWAEFDGGDNASARHTLIEAGGETSTIVLREGMTADLFRADRRNNDLWFHVRGTDTGFLIKDYFDGNQVWQLEAADGTAQSMEDFIATSSGTGDLLTDAWNDQIAASNYSWRTWYAENPDSWQKVTDDEYKSGYSYLGAAVSQQIYVTSTIEHRLAADGLSYVLVDGGTRIPHLSSIASGEFSNSENHYSFGYRETVGGEQPWRGGYSRTQVSTDVDFAVTWNTASYQYLSYYYLGQHITPLSWLVPTDGSPPAMIEWAEAETWLGNLSAGVSASSTSILPRTQGSATLVDVVSQLVSATNATIDLSGDTEGVLNMTLPDRVQGTHVTYYETYLIEGYRGGPGDDVLYFEWDVLVDGGAGNDILISNISEMGLAFGGGGDDTIVGGSADDVLAGGEGNDFLAGGGGDDTFLIVGQQSGWDVIDEAVPRINVVLPNNGYVQHRYNEDAGHGSTDTVRFDASVTLDSLRFSNGWWHSEVVDNQTTARPYSTLDISWGGGGGIRLVGPEGGYDLSSSDGFGVEFFQFADGSVYAIGDILARAANQTYQAGNPDRWMSLTRIQNGTVGQDVLISRSNWNGIALNRVLNGGDGFDQLFGSAEGDILIGGDSFDYIYGNAGGDVLIGGAGSDYLDGQSGNDTMVGGSGGDYYRVDSAQDVVIEASVDPSQDGYDTVASTVSYSLSDSVENLYLASNAIAGTGNDIANQISGNAADNLIDGRGGADYLSGGTGSDTYLFRRGSGNDTIYDAVEDGVVDVIQFAADIGPGDVSILIGQDGLKLHYGDDSVVLQGWFSISAKNKRVEFSDGTVWDATYLDGHAQWGSNGNDYIQCGDGPQTVDALAGDDIVSTNGGDDDLTGGTGNDWLYGGSGSDTYRFGLGDGLDRIWDEQTAGDVDVISFANTISPDDLIVTRGYDSIGLGYGNGSDRVELMNWYATYSDFKSKRVEFSDGTFWNAGEIEARVVTASATESGDVIYATDESETIDSLGGDDEVYALGGNDVVLGGAGDDYIEAGTGVDILYGGDGADDLEDYEGIGALMGDAGDDYVWSGFAASFLVGGTGADLIDTDASNDVVAFNRGDGMDVVRMSQPFTLSLGGGITPADISLRWNDASVVLDLGGGDQIELNNYGQPDLSQWPAVRLQVIGDEISWFDLSATMGDFVSARDQDPNIVSWNASDALAAHALGSSMDRAYGGSLAVAHARNGSLDAMQPDVLRAVVGEADFGSVPQPIVTNHAPVVGSAIADQEATSGRMYGFTLPADTFADADAGDDLLLSATLISGDPLPAWLVFDAATRTFSGIPSSTSPGLWNVRVTVSDRAGAIASDDFVLDVADHIVGTAAADTLTGTALRDVIEGFDGNDTLTAGAGSDWLSGGAGDDVYVFNRGDGFDRISNRDVGSDLIRLGAGIAPADVSFSFDAEYVLSIAGTEDSIAIDADLTTLPQVEFADGTVWNRSTLLSMVTGRTGTEGDDLLVSTAASNLLNGGAGDDTYFVGSSPPSTHIVDGAGMDTLILDGVNLADISLGVGSLKITVTATGQEIHIDNFDPDNPYAESGIEYFRFADGTFLSKAELIDDLGFHPTGTGGDDILAGTSLGDVITGLGGSDTLFGRGGNDILDGGNGDDAYVYVAGGGRDRIDDEAGIDRIVFDAGISFSQVTVTRDNGEVTLNLSDTDSIRFAENGSGNYAVEQIEFSDGTVWQAGDVLRRLSLTPPIVATALADQAATEDVAFEFAVPAGSFVDADAIAGDVLSYATSRADGTPLPIWLAFDATTQSFAGTPGNEDVGNLDLTVTATDLAGTSVSSSFRISVANTNDAPIVGAGITAAQATEDAAYAFTVPDDAFTDVDLGDTLILSAALANGDPLPTWLAFDPTTWTISGSPLNDDVGSLSVTVIATDAVGASASQVFTLSVANTNDAPTVGAGITAVQATEDAALAFTVPDDAFGDDDVGDTLTLSASLTTGAPLPAWLSFDPATRTFSGIPANDDVGTVGVRLTAADTAGAAAIQSFDLTVINTNDAPLTIGDAGAVTEDLAATASGNLLANDRDPDIGDVLGVADSGSRSGSYGQLTLAANGDWSYQLDSAAVQSLGADETLGEQFTYTAFDGQVAVQGTLDISVGGSNDAPLLTAPLAAAKVRAGRLFSWNLPAGAFVDADAHDTLGFSASLADGSPLPDWLSVDAASGAMSGTPGPCDAGEISVQLTATDGSGATAAGTLALSVALTLPGQTFVGTRQADTLMGTIDDDVFDGRAGVDTLIGLDGNDLYLVTDRKDRIVEQANEGFDTVWADTDGYALPDQVDGLALIGGEDYDGAGNGLGNLLVGNRGDNRLDGLAGDDMLRGLAGDDRLLGGAGLDALDGGAGDDMLEDGAGAGFLAGGRGDDSLRLDGGADVIAFNRGDGEDRVEGGDGQNDTLSLGGGIRVGDLRLKKHGKDLIVDVGNGDSLQFDDWYKHSAKRSIATLQVAADATGTSFERYDFAALVRTFDSVLAANKRTDSWMPGSDASHYRLNEATGDVAGGSLAATYASSGALADIRPEQVSAALATPLSDATATNYLPDMPLPPQPTYHGDHGDHGGRGDHHGSDGHGKDDRHDRDNSFAWHGGSGQFLTQREVEAAWQSWQQQAAPSPSASPIDYAMGWARLRDKLAGHHDENDWGGAWCSRVGGGRVDGFPLTSAGPGGFAGRGPIGLPGTALKTFEGLHEGFDRLHGS